jgi:NADH-quinone oxidoreductase subunit H
LNYYITYFIVAVGLFSFSAFFALFGVYAERKISAFIQDRLGPTETGKFGSLQTLADIIKMIQKELIIPAAADKWLFMLAPAVIFIAVYMGFAALPWGPGAYPIKNKFRHLLYLRHYLYRNTGHTHGWLGIK